MAVERVSRSSEGVSDESGDEYFSYRVRSEDEQCFIDEFGRFWTDAQFDLISSGFKSSAGNGGSTGPGDDERVDPVADPVRARDILLNPRSEIRLSPRPFVLALADYLHAAGADAPREIDALSQQHDFYLLEFRVGARPVGRERFTAVTVRFDHPGTEPVMTYLMSPDTSVGRLGTDVVGELDASLRLHLAVATEDSGKSRVIHRWRHQFLPASIVALGHNENYAEWRIAESKHLIGSIPFVTVTCVPKGCRSLTVSATGSYQVARSLPWWPRPTTVEIDTVKPVVVDLPNPVGAVAVGGSARPRAGRPVATAAHAPALEPSAAAVVITMVDVEYQAVRRYLGSGPREQVEHGTIYEVGRFSGRHHEWSVAATQIGPGNDVASVELERAVRVFDPDVVLLIGVAGGRKDASLGDVVVADAVYDYESGKAVKSGVLPRIKTESPSYGLVGRSRRVALDDQWLDRLAPEHRDPRPSVFVKPIAAGSKLVAHDRSATARLIDLNCGDAVAVEMEGVGFLRAAYRNDRVSALVVRGVSDLLTGKNEQHDRQWQPVAAARAAAFAFEVLANYDPRT